MLGGSTNLVLHMAIADSFDIKIDLDYFNNLMIYQLSKFETYWGIFNE